MFQRLLLTTSLSGGQWLVVLGLSLLAPTFVAIDKAIQLRQLDRERTPSQSSPEITEVIAG
jgi:Ca2+-transporting ATPase